MTMLNLPVSSDSAFFCLPYTNRSRSHFSLFRRAAMSCSYSTGAGMGRRRFPRLITEPWATAGFYAFASSSMRAGASTTAALDRTHSVGLLPILFGEPWTGGYRLPHMDGPAHSRSIGHVKVKSLGLNSIFFGEP